MYMAISFICAELLAKVGAGMMRPSGPRPLSLVSGSKFLADQQLSMQQRENARRRSCGWLHCGIALVGVDEFVAQGLGTGVGSAAPPPSACCAPVSQGHCTRRWKWATHSQPKLDEGVCRSFEHLGGDTAVEVVPGVPAPAGWVMIWAAALVSHHSGIPHQVYAWQQHGARAHGLLGTHIGGVRETPLSMAREALNVKATPKSRVAIRTAIILAGDAIVGSELGRRAEAAVRIPFKVTGTLRLKVVKVRRWKDFQNLGGVPCHSPVSK